LNDFVDLQPLREVVDQLSQVLYERIRPAQVAGDGLRQDLIGEHRIGWKLCIGRQSARLGEPMHQSLVLIAQA